MVVGGPLIKGLGCFRIGKTTTCDLCSIPVDLIIWPNSQIDLISILTVGLERVCDGGSCGGNNLHLKRFPHISLSFMLVSRTTVRIRISPT